MAFISALLQAAGPPYPNDFANFVDSDKKRQLAALFWSTVRGSENSFKYLDDILAGNVAINPADPQHIAIQNLAQSLFDLIQPPQI